eukprot:8710728-Pyramimonas_sp.AAC.1
MLVAHLGRAPADHLQRWLQTELNVQDPGCQGGAERAHAGHVSRAPVAQGAQGPNGREGGPRGLDA